MSWRQSVAICAAVVLCVSTVQAKEKKGAKPVRASASTAALADVSVSAVKIDAEKPQKVEEQVEHELWNPALDIVSLDESSWKSVGVTARPGSVPPSMVGDTSPRCVLVCEQNEGEPDCYDGYDDVYNSGCLYAPGNFQPLAIGETVCGTSGTYVPAGWPFEQPALDYYSITVDTATELTIRVTPEFLANVGLSVPHPELYCDGPKQQIALLEWLEPCVETEIVECVPPGTYWLGINPTIGHNIPCDVKYEISVFGRPCDSPSPINDDCEDATEVLVPSTTEGDLLFAQTDYVPECVINQSGVGVWYKVIGTGNVITASTCSPDVMSNTMISVFCGGCDGLFCVGGSDWDPDCPFQGSAVSWCSVLGEEYLIRLSGDTSETAYELTISDDGEACDAPASCSPVDTSCQLGDISDGEPICFDGYVDNTNCGCDGMMPVFTPISIGDSVCGTSGWYYANPFHNLDSDWYEITVSEDTTLTWSVQAEFQSRIFLYSGSAGCDSKVEIAKTDGVPHQFATISACVPAGTYWLVVMPRPEGGFLPCGATYRAFLDGGPCSIPVGSCCLLDGTCVESTQDACEFEHTGFYQGNGVICDDVECTTYAAADFCTDAIEVDVPSSTLGTTVMATSDGGRTCGDVFPGTGVWFKVVGTGSTMTATAYGVVSDFGTELSVYCAGCDVQRCVGSDRSGCPFMGPASPNTVSWCSELGEEYLIFVQACVGEGDFWLDVSDDATPCDSPAECESCSADFVVTAPGSWTGNTCGAVDDCVQISGGSYEDHVYEVTIPYDGMWVFSLCGSSFTTALAIGTDCCMSDIALVEATSIPCQNPEYVAFVEAGTYYLSVEGADWMPMCGEYALRVYEADETCSLECPTGAGREQEICGQQKNEGCEMMPPSFESIQNGQTKCGTFWSDASTFGNDWYEVVLEERAVVTWTLDCETYTVLGMPDSMNPGDGECASLTGQFKHVVISGACQEVTLTTDVLPPGRHWFLIGPWMSDQPCEKKYIATVSWEPPPSGACCMGDGSCTPNMMEGECNLAGGHYQGLGTVCDEVVCEPFYCEASGMCEPHINRVQVGDIDHASDCESYAYFADVSTTMEIGGEYDISFTVPAVLDFMFTGSVWIDWDRNHTFDVFGELLQLTAQPGLDETVYSGTIAVPEGTVPGATLMRVRLQWGQEAIACGEEWSNGEVEDYTIVVASTLCGDLDGDSDVDNDDYTIFREAFGGVVDADPPQDYLCDYDNSGAVGMADYSAWLACYREYQDGNP